MSGRPCDQNCTMTIKKSKTAVRPVIALLVTTTSINLLAGTNGFVIPTFRGSAKSEHGYWEALTVASGAPGNLPDQAGKTTSAVLTQLNTNAFLTGSGNIYNLSTSAFVLTNSPAFTFGTVVLQTRTI